MADDPGGRQSPFSGPYGHSPGRSGQQDQQGQQHHAAGPPLSTRASPLNPQAHYQSYPSPPSPTTLPSNTSGLVGRAGSDGGFGSAAQPSPYDPNYLPPPPPPPPAQQSSSSSGSAPRPIRRRMRMITSCFECRRRKLRCDKSQPCANCTKFSRECVYFGPKLDEASQIKLTEIKEKVGSLERQLERDVAKSATPLSQQGIIADDVEGISDSDRDLEITPMVALDLTYDTYGDDTDNATDFIDLGIKVGKMRITERIGGLSRPRLSEEVMNEMNLSPSRLPPCEPDQVNQFPQKI